jgi:sulfite exporter TauE/SafE
VGLWVCCCVKTAHRLAFAARVGPWMCGGVVLEFVDAAGGSNRRSSLRIRVAFGARVGLWVCCCVKTAHRLAFAARVGTWMCGGVVLEFVDAAGGSNRRSSLRILIISNI